MCEEIENWTQLELENFFFFIIINGLYLIELQK